MQFSLFDDENLCRIGWHNALKAFDLPAALENLHSWQKTLDAPPQIEQKIKAVQRLQKEIYAESDNVLANLSVLRKGYAQIEYLSALKKEFKYLREGLNRALTQNIEPGFYEFLIPDLHPAEIFMELGKFDRVVETTEEFFRHFGEHAYLRQIQAYALFKLGQNARANTVATFALFNDPFKCTERFLLPGDFSNKFKYLKYKTGSEKTAWLRLPLALWLDSKTYISSQETQYEQLLLNKTEKNRGQAKYDTEAGQLQFIRLLYLAETERLRLSRGQETETLKQLRAEMKELNRELFEAYLGLLRSFRNF